MDKPIQLPTHKYKSGDYVWYVRDSKSVFKNAYICSWEIQLFSSGFSAVKYEVGFFDPEVDAYEDATEWDVCENRLFDNELDARRKQLELIEQQYKMKESELEALDRLNEATANRIRELKIAKEQT